jgi:hypothetical protein
MFMKIVRQKWTRGYRHRYDYQGLAIGPSPVVTA